MRVLVTGSRGLLGSAIRRVGSDYAEYELISDPPGDLRDLRIAAELIQACRPDAVIHCAAKVGGIKKNRSCPEGLLFDNLTITGNMIHAASQAGVARFVAFGSNCMYGDVPELRTDNIHVGEPFGDNRAYGFAKRMVDLHLEAARTQYRMKTLYVVPVSMFGPGDNFNLEDSHVIPALIHKCFLAQDELRIWGDGSAIREVVFVDDVARAVLGLLGADEPRVVLGSGQFVSVKEMAETIAKEMKFGGRIVCENDNAGGQRIRPPAQRFPFNVTPFGVAIQKTCEWFKANYPHLRK